MKKGSTRCIRWNYKLMVSGNPCMRLKFCTAAPAAPFMRLSRQLIVRMRPLTTRSVISQKFVFAASFVAGRCFTKPFIHTVLAGWMSQQVVCQRDLTTIEQFAATAEQWRSNQHEPIKLDATSIADLQQALSSRSYPVQQRQHVTSGTGMCLGLSNSSAGGFVNLGGKMEAQREGNLRILSCCTDQYNPATALAVKLSVDKLANQPQYGVATPC